jgi:hypothetical protein
VSEEVPEEDSPEVFPRGTPLFQISEPDLQTLEQLIPHLMWTNPMVCNETSVRMKWRRVQEILSNVRWRGGPPSNVECIPAGDD